MTIEGFIGANHVRNFQDEFISGNYIAVAAGLASLVGDLLLASILIHVLHRSRTGFKKTDSMIDLMIMYSVSTGLLTGIGDILNTILAFVFPGKLVYAAVGIPTTKLYANALLAALNSRQYIASCGGSNVSDEISAFGFAPAPVGSTSSGDAYTPQPRRAMRDATNDADMAPAVIELNFVESAVARGVRAGKEVV
ncbi:uncharacterized protein TRAVEDRAFT_74891 [Trametes versicolor FP-101664 SS1]|uniref:uncharacterized protein n=1 Tax=Trametes versicolor (strain FP-101664) TaxID=717944 RepID=UPI000462220F|nr:uncharacterized protein TRAVEDRAFT_74891 [Trametes versicolor FP-101664 SS1]EIW53739.1 hypothetical protein TRAVEDRAFT_74891 [Trametes versicolor FP-101664 SS1]